MSENRAELSDYLLGELDEHRRRRLEERLGQDPELRAELDSLRPVVTMLTELPGDAWPPPAAPPETRPQRRLVTRTRLALAAAGAAVTLIAGIVGYQLHGGGASRPAAASRVVLRPLAHQSLDAHATALLTGGGRIIVMFSGLPRPRSGEFYELWLMSNAAHLVALASFNISPSGSASLNLPLPVNPRRFTYLDVSLQAAAAGPAHSGDSVLRGKVPS